MPPPMMTIFCGEVAVDIVVSRLKSVRDSVGDTYTVVSGMNKRKVGS